MTPNVRDEFGQTIRATVAGSRKGPGYVWQRTYGIENFAYS